ncbi:MAG: M1 family metallopeptidase [Pyrinomonadaceae bacterium]
MKRIFFPVIFAIFFFTVYLPAQTSRPEFNRKQTFDVQHYKIETSFDRAKHEIYGTTTITLKPLAANFGSFELDAVGLSFKKVKVEPSGTDLKFRTSTDKIFITLDKAYGPDDIIAVTLTYSAKPKKGVYFVDPQIDSGKEVRSAQIYSQGEADENRHWFPSFDFPSDKATTEQIITAEKDFTVIANGELLSKKENANGTVTWHYKMPVPHSSYLVSFVIGKYAKVEDKYKDIPLGYYVYPGREATARKAYANTPAMIRIYEELTGVAFPYNKYDQTVVAAFNFGGMENITATTMADTEIFAVEIPFLAGNIEDLVSHELAHSWFGDLVTCRNWAELWLNEGFATFMEAAYREKMYDRKDYMRMIADDAEGFITEDAVLPNNHALFNQQAGNVAALFDHSGVTYSKGGAVIHTLREQVGDAAFWKAINIYLNRHKFASVETQDLQNAMEETSGQDLGWFFAQWVYGTGFPKLTVAPVWNAAKKTLTITVTQTQKTGGANTAAYKLPMKVNFDFGPLGKQFEVDSIRDVGIAKRSEVFTFKLPRKPIKVELDKENRIPIKSVKVLPIR